IRRCRCSRWIATRSFVATGSIRPTYLPTPPWKEPPDEGPRIEVHGPSAPPPEGAQAPDDRLRVREGRGPRGQGQRRPPLVPPSALGAGAPGARAQGRRA